MNRIQLSSVAAEVMRRTDLTNFVVNFVANFVEPFPFSISHLSCVHPKISLTPRFSEVLAIRTLNPTVLTVSLDPLLSQRDSIIQPGHLKYSVNRFSDFLFTEFAILELLNPKGIQSIQPRVDRSGLPWGGWSKSRSTLKELNQSHTYRSSNVISYRFSRSRNSS